MMHHLVKRTCLWMLALLCGALIGHAQAQPLLGSTWDPLAGSSVFGNKGCNKCHTLNGAGGAARLDLARLQGRRSFYDLAAAMWNHLPRMIEAMQQRGIRPPHLDPQDTGNLIAFLETLNYFDPPGDAAAGKQLFAEKKCLLCHQVGGVGGVIGPSLDFREQFGSPIAVAVAMWNHSPAMVEAMRVKAIERPTFKDAELLDIIAYLKSASKAPATGSLHVFPGRAHVGRQLFAQKRCIECHSIEGQEALWSTAGPPLGKRDLHQGMIGFATAMWNKIPAMLKAMQARNIPVPRLRAQEMADLIAYLYSVQYLAGLGDAQAGRQLAADKGCLNCHAVSGEGGQMAADFARIPGLDSPAVVVSALWNHAAVMAPSIQARGLSWPQLNGEAMADLIAFLQTIGQRQ